MLKYKPKLGQYHYAPYARGYRIYVYDKVTDSGSSASPTGEFFSSREEARKRVYSLNGWKLK